MTINEDYLEALEVLADLVEDHYYKKDCVFDEVMIKQMKKVERYRLADVLEET